MDSFDQTVQKAKEVFSVACQKTGEVVNTQKLKIDLAALQSKLTKAYAKLGELQYDKLISEDTENIALKAALSQIKSLLEQIDEIKEKIGKMQGKINCPVCGGRISEDSKFCSICGANLETQNDENKA